jgi:chemotaxis methyl-accepting protein methylase
MEKTIHLAGVEGDMLRLERMFEEVVTPVLSEEKVNQLRILNLACGACDEAETLIKYAKKKVDEDRVEMIGADIRIREIRQAREKYQKLPVEFLIQDASQLNQHESLSDVFDMVFLRHQNFWHGQELWKKIFDQGVMRLNQKGHLVITSYFDEEHRLAVKALEEMGMELLVSKRNPLSRELKDARGKSVDRWMAIFKIKVKNQVK